eukprot:CAMPEP_0177592910 /NCGR_PEP_ID=MMETSP0419_2-20121207/8821_1 /TAXON_ID=582737 /ORGANISM="Tetraselmis sp., Strain GSL018" /LENGTH=58 /DNA_ID=CAMNT_0019083827 /DNA_START=113 /DNA_END=286 /DNA_ORIENTATION=+
MARPGSTLKTRLEKHWASAKEEKRLEQDCTPDLQGEDSEVEEGLRFVWDSGTHTRRSG